MTAKDANSIGSRDGTDLLLILGGAGVAGIALSWLLLAQPWRGAEEPSLAIAPPAAARSPAARRLEVPARSSEELLRMARLAYDAGMLVEPERYSAWSLYAELVDAEPTNAEARDGLARVADALVERAAVALEQGRTGDAGQSLEWVLDALPNHTAALRLETRRRELNVEAAAAERAAARAEAARLSRQAAPERLRPGALNSPTRAAPAPVDPLDALRSDFAAALAAGALLQPEDGSARAVLERMATLDVDHAHTAAAREALFSALLERAHEAIARFDSAGASAWIDAAATLGQDAARVALVRERLLERRVAAESQTPLPAAELTLAAYVPPRYPRAAANLEIEGWVDVEFVVAVDGTTADVAVIAASHDELFRDEAVAAVAQWRFEPRIFLDRAIAQSAYTRIRFALE